MLPHIPVPPDEHLESVLGATPHEFESRILRQCLTGHYEVALICGNVDQGFFAWYWLVLRLTVRRSLRKTLR